MFEVELPLITDATFEAEVLDSPRPVMVYVWSPTCATCLLYTPIIEVLADTFSRQARVVRLIAEDNPAFLRRYEVLGAPTLLLFTYGRLVDRLVGFHHQRMIAMHFADVVEMDEARAAAKMIPPRKD